MAGFSSAIGVLTSAVILTASLGAQAPASTPAPPRSVRQSAPIDLTGNWVSVVTEDWRWRMVTPLKGDAASVPINAEARKIVDAWDPVRDEADRSEEHTSELQSLRHLVCRLLLEK